MEQIPEYQQEICLDIQHDLNKMGCQMDVDAVHRFWLDYSDLLASGFLGYRRGELDMLESAMSLVLHQPKSESKDRFYCVHEPAYKGFYMNVIKTATDVEFGMFFKDKHQVSLSLNKSDTLALIELLQEHIKELPDVQERSVNG